jgi:uncharacterized protein YfdQ (DUF2303 family)
MNENNMIEEAGAAGLAADLATKLTKAQSEPKTGKYLDAAPYIILRDKEGNERIEPVKATIDRPERKAGAVKLDDVESFIAYVLRHKSQKATIYGTIAPAKFIAVLNDHAAESEVLPSAGMRDFRANYPIAFSREWETWKNHDGAGAAFKSTEAFALFVEDNAPDIIKPEAAKMLQIALNFRVTQGVNFVSANRLQDGNVDFTYSNTVDATGKGADGKKLAIPELFTIEVPIFHGIAQERVKIDARFRFRLDQGRLALWYELVRPTRAVEDAYRKLWERVKKDAGCPMFLGEP